MSPTAPWRRDILLLFIAIGLFFAIGLGERPYLTPSEARYIELPRQMLVTGDFLTPRINGVPYFEKPPLFYWMQASIMGPFGMGEFAGRIATSLLVTFTCLLTYACGRMLYGRETGMLAAAVMASSVLGYALSRIAELDVPVTLFITATLVCFLAAQQTGKRGFYLLMYAASALAMMSKGLIGIVIPGLVIGTWIIASRRWGLLREGRLVTGLIIFLALAAPWHLLMAGKHPDFLNFYFIHEHFTRYLTDEHKRNQPWWFFIAVTAAGLLPWTGLVPGAMKRLKPSSDPAALFLLLWIVLPLVFFSTSHSKLASYIFPIFPPLCILLGQSLSRILKGELASTALRASALLTGTIFAVAAVLYFALPATGKAAATLEAVRGVPPALFLPVGMAMVLLLIAGLRGGKAAILLLLAAAAIIDISANVIAAAFDQSTTKPLVQALLPQLQEGDMVVAYESYWQDLPVYLNRNVIVAGYTGELAFGTEHYPETHGWMISDSEFWQRCATAPHAVYVFMNRATAENQDFKMPDSCQLHLVDSFGKTVLLKKEAK